MLKEQGARGFFRGWAPTLLWLSALAACKIGFSQFFKRYYSDIAGPEYATKYQMLIYLASFTSAEVIADVSLWPFEAVKVRVQTAWICKGIAWWITLACKIWRCFGVWFLSLSFYLSHSVLFFCNYFIYPRNYLLQIIQRYSSALGAGFTCKRKLSSFSLSVYIKWSVLSLFSHLIIVVCKKLSVLTLYVLVNRWMLDLSRGSSCMLN